MLQSLRFRAATAYVLLIVTALAALGLYLLREVETDFRDNIERDLGAQALMVESLARPLMERGATQQDFDRLAKDLGADGDTRITIIAREGTVLGDSQADPTTTENHLSRPEVQEALRSGLGADDRTSATVGEELTYVALRVSNGDEVLGFVRVARPSAAVNASLSDITRSVLIAVVVTGLAAGVLSLLISGSVLRPVGRLTRAARALAAGRLEERIAPRPSGEVGELADAFNQMGEELQGLIAAASQERNRLQAALNSSGDAVIAVDAEGRITFANVAAERLFIRSQEELVGNPFAWVMPNEKVLEGLRASREDGRRSVLLVERPNQGLQVTAAPIVGGGEWASLIVIHDLTEVRRTEQIRRDFIANVSHELRTPLASIKAVIETLEGGALQDSEAAKEFLSRADEEVDRLVQMVEELLELSRLESGQAPLARKPVEMRDVLQRAVGRLSAQAEKQSIRLTLDVRSDLPPVLGDAERLERAVINLVHNALKFTPAGGDVTVSAALTNGSVTARVADTGVGIAPGDLPRIFERFYKADRARAQGGGRGGTGLGLAVVKHTVEAHGGTVAVNSRHGEGSTFTISLPAMALPAGT